MNFDPFKAEVAESREIAVERDGKPARAWVPMVKIKGHNGVTRFGRTEFDTAEKAKQYATQCLEEWRIEFDGK